MIVPSYLEADDTIGIVATARSVRLDDLTDTLMFIQQQGFQIKLANNVGKSYYRFAGTDDERTFALQNMLDDPEVKAIICARGGYGTTRMMGGLNWEQFLKRPKWICGYSDITALHGKVNRLGVASIHGRMVYDPRSDEDQKNTDLQDLINLLKGKPVSQQLSIHTLRKGNAVGRLVGGNLTLLNNSIGTDYQPDFEGAILMIEDVDEYLYNIDRMMYHLNACGILAQIAGLVVGSFTAIKDDEPPFGSSIKEIMLSVAEPYRFPIIQVDAIGHGSINIPLILGKIYQIDARSDAWPPVFTSYE